MTYELLPGNRITLLRSGVEYFPVLEQAIRAAQREIYLESYIYEADETGWRITNALADAARRGVAVHVLVDGFGAKAMPPEMVQALARAGAERLVYRPEISPFRIRKYRLRRMHRKLVARVRCCGRSRRRCSGSGRASPGCGCSGAGARSTASRWTTRRRARRRPPSSCATTSATAATSRTRTSPRSTRRATRS
jgi:hypothetical protein